MRKRQLGNTGLMVSEIGFGTWQLADDPGMWVGANKDESLRALILALENGVNFIDTALIYGNGSSEKLIGEALKKWNGERPYIASKIYPKNMRWPATGPIEDAFPEDWIHKAVDESLRNLGVEQIDLMQFHVWDDSYASTEYWKKAIKEITQQGKVRYWGLSLNNYQPMNCIKTLETGLISTIQLIFNIFHQEPIDTIFPIAKSKKIGIIARTPLDEGGLTGRINEKTVFFDGDFRANFFGGDRKKELSTRTAELDRISSGKTSSLAELALRFVLSFDEVSTVIPGMRREAQVIENAKVSDKGPLPKELAEQLKKHSWERNFYENAIDVEKWK